MLCVLFKRKDKDIEAFVFHKNEVENQLNKKFKVLRSNRGCEYESTVGESCASVKWCCQAKELYLKKR